MGTHACYNYDSWSYADTANGLMVVPNLIALVALSGAVIAMTKKYMREKVEGLHKPFARRDISQLH